MNEAYSVYVKITAIDDGVSNLLRKESAQFSKLQLQADKLSGSFLKIKKTGLGGDLLKVGIGVAGFFGYAITKAAELQKVMISIQESIGGTTQQMDAMRASIEKSASTTMFSVSDVANMALTIAKSNTFNAAQTASVLPAYSKFADVQYLLNNTPYQTSVSEGVKLAHLAGYYGPKELTDFLDVLTKATLVSPGHLTEIGTALKYSLPTARAALGITPEQMVMMTALASQMGFSGSRGGTNVIDAMIRTVPGIFGSGLLEGKSNEALRAMGLTDSKGHSKLFTNGNFDFIKWIEGLSAYVNKEMATHPKDIAYQDILINFQHAFGAQGRRFAALLTTPQALQQWKAIGEKFQRLSDLGSIQDDFVNNSVAQQWKTAVTNFQTFFIELGYNLLPLATSVLKRLNNELNILIPWMRKHRELVKELTESMIAFSAVLGVTGLLMAINNLLNPLAWVVTGIFALAGALSYLYKQLPHIGSVATGGASAAVIKKSTNSFTSGFYAYSPYGAVPGASLFQSVASGSNLINKAGSSMNSTINQSHVPLHATINVGGKTVTKVITKAQAKAANAPNTSTTTFNPSHTLSYPAHVLNGNS
jgi:TP901 family phage tail tape measure protein